MTLREEVARILPEAIEMRRYLHSHPELSGQEVATRAYICEKLQAWGISYTHCTGNLGVVADIGQGSPCVALRVDTDALPILEQTDLPFASQTPGVMHACGHDVHTAVLLAVAKLLNIPTLPYLLVIQKDLNIEKTDYIAEICELNHINADDIQAGEYIIVAYYSKEIK